MTIRLSCLSDIIPALMAEAKANPNIQELMRAICSVVPEKQAGYSYREHIDFVTENKTETVELRINLEREALEEFELLDLSGEIKLQVKTPINYLSSKAYAFVVTMRPYSTKSIEIRSRELRKYLDWFVSQVERHHATSIESFEKWVEAHPYTNKKLLPKIRLPKFKLNPVAKMILTVLTIVGGISLFDPMLGFMLLIVVIFHGCVFIDELLRD